MTKVSGVAVRLAQTERLLDRVLKLKDRWQIRALNAEAYSEDMPKPIISEDLSNALADCVPKSAMPYVLSHLKGRMYSRAMAKLRDAHHEEFEELYRAEVQGYVDEHARDGDDAARA